MRLVFVGLILTGCVHQKVYTLGHELTVISSGMEVVVRNERPPVIVGMSRGPLFMVRPGKSYPTTGCYDGFYNPNEVLLQDTAAQRFIQPFVLCHDAEAARDPDAFRLRLRAIEVRGDHVGGRGVQVYDQGIKEFQFTARVAASSTEVHVAGADPRRLRLPDDAGVFREHPEFIGALIALDILPSSITSLDR